MDKRVFIVHGWEGYPEEGWFPYLKREFEARDFKVYIPQLPDAETPRIYNWVPALAAAVGAADEHTYFVGHSLGCQTIARYLEGLADEVRVGGAVFVGGFFKRLTGLGDDPAVQATDKHWLTTPISLEKVKSHLPKSVAIFSDDDPWVPLDNQEDFRDKLGSKIIILSNKKHFSGSEGIMELPEALDAILSIST